MMSTFGDQWEGKQKSESWKVGKYHVDVFSVRGEGGLGFVEGAQIVCRPALISWIGTKRNSIEIPRLLCRSSENRSAAHHGQVGT
eukprot:767877-Hanusia_phi.AAC.2